MSQRDSLPSKSKPEACAVHGIQRCTICLPRYGTIVADPPWSVQAGPRNFGPPGARSSRPYSGAPRNMSRRLSYPTMTVEQIAAIPVSDWAAPDAHLYIWTINRYVENVYAIARAWGFEPSTLLVWAKSPKGRGLGGSFSTATEYVLFSRRGNVRSGQRVERNWWNWPRTLEHSQKPDAFLDIVEQVSPGPYLEMFARRARFGWEYWGDQSLGTAEVAA